MECTHLLDNVKVDNFNVEDTTITKNFNCSECTVEDQNWLCLQCGVINCGRYVNGHAKLHAEALDHQLCMSCEVYSVYCYKCDDYVSNDLEYNPIDKIRQSIMQLRRQHDVESNGNLEPSEDNSKDGSEGGNSLGSSASVSDKPASLSGSGDDSRPGEVISTVSFGDGPNLTLEASESKPSKSIKNSEEPVRSLRPRSRKRTHSDDSSSTENGTTQTTRVKEKKTSPCNGKMLREKKIVGLKNLGNTCFMNAVLQSLNNIQEFSCYFSQLPSLEMKTNGRKVYHSRSYTRQEMHDVVMAEELRKVLINLNSGCGSKGAISPECLFLVIWKVVPRFRGYQQQDAHEFLRYMLDRLHTELQQLLPAERSDASFLPRAPSASIVTAVFGGTLQSERGSGDNRRSQAADAAQQRYPSSRFALLGDFNAHHQEWLFPYQCTDHAGREMHNLALALNLTQLDQRATRVPDDVTVRCLACGTESKKFDPFLDLSLELPDTGRHDAPVALADCLSSFVQVEELADTERYFCSSCKSKQKSTKQFWIRRLPNVLCLHLKRFRWHNYFRTKVDTSISFPLRSLDMSRFVLSNVPDTRRSGLGNNLYDLAAVIVHHGSGAGSGHYTAFAINEEQWFHFNDQTVRGTDAAAVAGCKPYILFYIRRELALT